MAAPSAHRQFHMGGTHRTTTRIEKQGTRECWSSLSLSFYSSLFFTSRHIGIKLSCASQKGIKQELSREFVLLFFFILQWLRNDFASKSVLWKGTRDNGDRERRTQNSNCCYLFSQLELFPKGIFSKGIND